MSKAKLDKVWIGMVSGLLGAVLGFFLFAIGFGMLNDMSIGQFYSDVFLKVQDFQSRIVTISMLVDVVLFFIFIRKNYQQFCKGLIAVLVLSVIAVAWLY